FAFDFRTANQLDATLAEPFDNSTERFERIGLMWFDYNSNPLDGRRCHWKACLSEVSSACGLGLSSLENEPDNICRSFWVSTKSLAKVGCQFETSQSPPV